MTVPSERPRRGRYVAAVAGLGLLLASCAENAPQDTLEPEGPVADRINDLFVPVFWVAVAIFVLVQGGIIYSIVRFRRRSDDEVPAQTHGNTRLEIGWTIVPAAILAVITVPTIATVLDLDDHPPDAMQVEVYGAQWWWEYEYDNGVVTANELHVPTGREVTLVMTSRDVIHSYWIPKLVGKKDVVPGRTHRLTFEATETGEYFGQCAEFCGASHVNMRLRVFAHEPDEFDEWLEDQADDARQPRAGTVEAQGAELFTSRGCTSCHVIRGVNEIPRDVDRLNDLGVPWAPDLTHLASRTTFAGSLFDVNAPELSKWLRDPPAQKDGSLMPNLNLSEDDIDALVAYLLSLE
jgi:cytochrome c oxidase subunit 2